MCSILFKLLFRIQKQRACFFLPCKKRKKAPHSAGLREEECRKLVAERGLIHAIHTDIIEIDFERVIDDLAVTLTA